MAETYENQLFLLVLEGWRLENGHFGSLGEVLAWLLAGWLAGHGHPRIQGNHPLGGKFLFQGCTNQLDLMAESFRLTN